MSLQQSLEVLLGLKIRDEVTGLWRVYDVNGVEISDPGGILLRANPGALLAWPNPVVEEIVQQGAVSGSGSPSASRRTIIVRARAAAPRARSSGDRASARGVIVLFAAAVVRSGASRGRARAGLVQQVRGVGRAEVPIFSADRALAFARLDCARIAQLDDEFMLTLL
jgi:hypothetical protein